MDEDGEGEQLEIIEEEGRETLNGWSLMGRSTDSNIMVWEDTESYERVCWMRSGCDLERVLERMEDDIAINIVDAATGGLLCDLLAEKTWLVLDLLEAIQDQTRIPPQDQQLTYQGQLLARDDVDCRPRYSRPYCCQQQLQQQLQQRYTGAC
jgi:hypothetical protein